MVRKMVDITEMVESTNRALSRNLADTSFLDKLTPEQAWRTGIASQLERILHATGQYKGFNYQASEVVLDEGLRDGYDDTRRYYHI